MSAGVDTTRTGAVYEFRVEDWMLLSRLSEEDAKALWAAVLDGSLERPHVFRDNWRTLSARVVFRGEDLMLKIPRARNKRRWERLLTFFRGSDAARHFRHLLLMKDLGFSAPVPVLAAERKLHGTVIDSFVIYRYLEGRPASANDAGAVLSQLLALHEKGYLRNDPQLANFLISEGRVHFIDFRLKKPLLFRSLARYRELIRFLASAGLPDAQLPVPVRRSAWFLVARWLEQGSVGFRQWKKSRRRGKSHRQ